MRKAEIQRGKFYAIKHHQDTPDNLSIVRVLGPNPLGGYNCLKTSTGRLIRVKSAAKFRYETTPSGKEIVT